MASSDRSDGSGNRLARLYDGTGDGYLPDSAEQEIGPRQLRHVVPKDRASGLDCEERAGHEPIFGSVGEVTLERR